ncbi:PREDICTED: cytoskeleton-associated protein 5-like [Acropora digitifera]|uniref:cytoskeleton-associated protein 5-like n=1 Tax=Acropora digitifera TaxID=70779 RepID=UPI00077A0BC7|nr:PREDICTED: cytoskeleton-associated protein 5-like [Acropora digitifera]
MKREQSFEERANLLRSDDRRYKSLGSVHQNKCKVYKRRWYILIVFSICASLNNLIWNTWGPIQGTSQVVFGWDNTTITLMADWGPISFVVAVVPMCWLMDMKVLHCRVAGDVVAGVIIKCLNARPKTKEKGINIILMYIEVEKQDIVQVARQKIRKIRKEVRTDRRNQLERLGKESFPGLAVAFDNAVLTDCPSSDVDDGVVEEISVELREKVLGETTVGVQSSAANLLFFFTQILILFFSIFTNSEFGGKVFSLKPIVKVLPKLFDHSDKTVREEAKVLAIEIFKWIRDILKTQLQNIKPVQLKELEEAWRELPVAPPAPTRFTRSQQAKMAEAGPVTPAAVDGDETTVHAGVAVPEQEAIDPYDLIEAVEILSKLPKDFYENLENKKWQLRKEALEALEKLASNPKLEGGQYGELVGALKKIISKDANVVVVSLAAKCIGLLATGLRKKFSQYAALIALPILEKFKEKKTNVVAALREAIDAVFLTTNLPAMQEDLLATLESKNPSVKEETVRFLTRSFCKSTPASLPKTFLKPTCGSLLKRMDDTSGPVRDATAEALGTLLKVMGERPLNPFIEQLDKIKMDKVKECAEKAEVKATPGGSAGAAAKPSAPAATSTDGAKKEAPTKKPTQKQSKPAAKAVESAKPASGGGGAKKKPPSSGAGKAAKGKKKGASVSGFDSEEPTESEMTPEEVDAKAAEIISEAVLKQLADSNWKERLAGIEALTEQVKNMDPSTSSQVLIRVLAKKPGWKDTNFQLKDASKETITTFAETISLNYISLKVSKHAGSQKNPKVLAESLNWLSDSIKGFGFKIDLKPHIAYVKEALTNTNPAVRTAAISLLGTLYMYVGQTLRMFFEEEKPALLQQIDAEFEKMKGEKPPAPTLGVTPKGGDDEEEGEDEEDGGGGGGNGTPVINMADLVDRVDISNQITTALITELGDKNWKVRGEALQKVVDIISSAKFITPELGELPPALKARLGDSNKNLNFSSSPILVMLSAGVILFQLLTSFLFCNFWWNGFKVTIALNICASIATAMGPNVNRHLRILGAGIFSTLADAKNTVRATGITALNAWHKEIGLTPFIEAEVIFGALSTENPNLRTEVLTWLEEKLPAEKNLPKELVATVAPLYSCLEDRSGDVRKKAQAVVPLMMQHVGWDAMSKQANKLKCVTPPNDAPYQTEVVQSLDLILKWVTLRFFDTNTTVLIKCLELMDASFVMLAQCDYQMLEFEASSFIPYLVQKVTYAVTGFVEGLTVFKVHYQGFVPRKKIESPSGSHPCPLGYPALKPECLEELGSLIQVFGMNVCQPTPQKAVAAIAGQIGDRDNGVRNAALNAVVEAYFLVGEKTCYKYCSQLSDKDLAYLEERIKRSSKNRPNTAPTENTAAKSNAVARTSVSESSTNGAKKKDEKRPNKAAQLARTPTSPHMGVFSRTNPTAAFNYVISQIASGDVTASTQSLVQFERVIRNKNHKEVSKHIDQFLNAASLQLNMILTTHIPNVESNQQPEATVLRLINCLTDTMLAVFSSAPLARSVSRSSLKQLMQVLITVLSDDRLASLKDGPQILRAINILMVKVIEMSDQTYVLGSLIKLLQDCLKLLQDSAGTSLSSPKFLDLVMKVNVLFLFPS